MSLIVVAGALVTPSRSAHAESTEDVLVEKMLGCHEFSGGRGQREALEGAIETVVDEFNFLVRPIVRGRLKKATPIPARLCIERHESELTISMDARRYRAPLNGKAVKVKGITGDELAMRFEVRDGQISQSFEGEDGGRVNVYRPTKGHGVDMRVRIFSERLPRDLVYGLTYRRASER